MAIDSIKSGIAKYFSKADVPIVVASFGRSGSTMLSKSLARSALGLSPSGKKGFVKKNIWTVNVNKAQGLVYKTHDYPPIINENKAKYIYIYSDPYDVVASLHRKMQRNGSRWIYWHARRMTTRVRNASSFLSEDSLDIEKHFDCWHKERGGNTLYIRLDRLWEKRKRISEYVGFDVRLPPQRQRKSTVDDLPVERRDLQKVYGNLRQKVMSTGFAVH